MCYIVRQYDRRISMAQTMRLLPSNINGMAFKTDDGTTFKVVEGEYFPRQSVGRQHNRYLDSLRPGLLVSVSFHGQPVPVVTVNGGVVRLAKIELDEGEVHDGARIISGLLGVMETRQPMGLYPSRPS
jgi:hypothetical protein